MMIITSAFSSLAILAVLGLPTTAATGGTDSAAATGAVFGDHCEQVPEDLRYVISIQELQSPTGPRHSDGIQNTGGDFNIGTGLGFVWFDNDLVQPPFGDPIGDQTGHCIQVSYEEDGGEAGKLACYFNFNLQDEGGCSGRITAEALFDLANFPNANLVITGGTGDFHGIRGNGCTQAIPVEETPEGVATFIYNFSYDFTGFVRGRRDCHTRANQRSSKPYYNFRNSKGNH